MQKYLTKSYHGFSLASTHSLSCCSNTNRALAKLMIWNIDHPHTGNACKISDLENRSAYAQVAWSQKFRLTPGPGNFKIWESASCSDSCCHRPNRNLPMFLLRKWPCRPLLLPKLKSDPGSGFSHIFTLDPGLKEKRRILPKSPRDLWPPLATSFLKHFPTARSRHVTRCAVTPCILTKSYGELPIEDSRWL